MRADGYAALGEQAGGIGDPGAAFEFDDLRAGPHQRGGVLQGLGFRGVAHERHVAHQQGAFVAALDATHVIDHVVHGDRQGAVVPLQHHAERVAHEQHFDAGAGRHAGEAGVIGRQADEFLARALHLVQAGQGDGAGLAMCTHDCIRYALGEPAL